MENRNDERIYILEFGGNSCANCLSLMKEVNRALKDRKDIERIHFEIDESSEEIVKKYHIDRVPTLIVMRGENEIARVRGYQPEEILSLWLEAKIQEAKGKER